MKSTPLSLLMSTQVYIHNHKDHLGKFDEKADDGYLLGYSLVSKAFRVFNTRRQQAEETYHIKFDESLDAIKSWNKRDETRISIKNKTRLVAQGYNLQEGIDYDETITPVARLEAIRIFLAFATYMNCIVLRAVSSPTMYALDKALYGLKQAPIAWYETLSTFLTEYKFERGFDLKGYFDSDCAGCNMDRKSTSVKAEYVAAGRCCANILWMKS
ncbi:retrovirus-related pol polyprotein from transposon TNT 1-94 [Tanacetum coccineum]